jgi:hypothetical protein
MGIRMNVNRCVPCPAALERIEMNAQNRRKMTLGVAPTFDRDDLNPYDFVEIIDERRPSFALHPN